MFTVAFYELVTETAPIELFEPETSRTVMAFPDPIIPPPTNTFPEPKSVTLV
jgi:hypothetical protein